MSAPTSQPASYRVLARTYRPQRFSELIGQDGLVRTLTNAFRTGRIAHAFLLTGIRGVGKTTTARIIARALNCTGPDGGGGPTPEPCGACESCRAIAEDRHLDVIEMDAATRTGIDDIREIVDAVRYAPSSSRYKVYIIDEVHMLSEKAFNGLLKTLEEPPPHAKFVFATTEVRKLPLTVLSRCQRFDLRRVDPGTLQAHLAGVAEREAVAVEPEALALIARAAEGSVRDGLSLLDQAIAMADGSVDAALVRDMLGLAEHGRLVDLFDMVMQGRPREAVEALSELHDLGAEPSAILQDLLGIAHALSRLKLSPEASEHLGLAQPEAESLHAMSERLTVPVLARAWQMLLKGIEELQLASHPLVAAEMVLIRLAHISELPPPEELARLVRSGDGAARPTTPDAPPAEKHGEDRVRSVEAPQQEIADSPEDLAGVVALCRSRGQPMLATWLETAAHPVGFEPGRIEIRMAEGHPTDVPGRLAKSLRDWTGRQWVVALAKESGAPTLAEQAETEKRRRIEEAAENPAVRTVLDLFPGARVVDVRPRRGAR